jgi:outer membrane protein assembly factor BamD
MLRRLDAGRARLSRLVVDLAGGIRPFSQCTLCGGFSSTDHIRFAPIRRPAALPRQIARPPHFRMTTMTSFKRFRLPVSAISVALLLGACDSLTRDETSRWTPEKLYAEAKEEAAAGNYDKAAKLYERLEGRAAGSVLAEQAQLERAYLLWKTAERAQALSVLERYIKLHPTSPALDYALYLQGLINFNDDLGFLGNLAGQDLAERDQQAERDAYQSFKQLVDQFPQSAYADDARLHMNFIVNALAAYEVHVARYYFRRGAYIAAVNRAQQTVLNYQQSPSTEEALFIMAQSYDKLGLGQLRDDAERVLKQNYPNTKLDVASLGSRRSRWWQIW